VRGISSRIASAGQRDVLVDALRGLALFGILAVNIQSFVWGVSGPSLGVLYESSSLADEVTVFLTALLFEYKFYPIFCFCFGYGFTIQTRRWIARGVDARAHFARRMDFMIFMGVMHGVFIWFGDILLRYAATSYLLRRHLRKGPRALVKAAKFWFCIVVAAAAVLAILLAATPEDAETLAQIEIARMDGEHVFSIYTEAGYVEASIQRVQDFLTVTATYVMVLPQVMLFFLLGALAAQLKLLRYPDRHRQFWWRVFWLGLIVGLPINIAFAAMHLSTAAEPWLPPTVWQALLSEFAPVMALAYVAAAALLHSSVAGSAFMRLLAPAGRVALTLYIGESVLMMLLLNGFGFALGAAFGQFELFITAVLMFAVLLIGAHLMLYFNIPGPLEGIWRRYTNAELSQEKIT
jgi:uncharacterized protein